MPVAVVTGAGSGIGRATAERFGRKGWTVVVSDINEATGAETVDRITRAGGSAVFRRLDVADLEDWRQFTDWVCEEHGIPDLLVNNAGILIAGGFLEQTGADWRRMIAINMMSPLVGSRLFVQRMVEAGARGHIANICSVGAFMPTPLAPSYVVAKQGAWFGTQALRAEFGKRGIGVSAICPGLIDTNLSANGTRSGVDETAGSSWTDKLNRGQHFFGRSPDHVAEAVERSMRWNLSTVPVGFEAWIGWFLYRLSPGLMRGALGIAQMSLAERAVDVSSRALTTLGIGGKR
ncbi:SDR family NAD(P)-dependent oxidoreductase [Mycobacteroides abscessus]|uniref:Oxidoreductase EphD n=3 Tax=Mycobacteroides abscessus TaxID=36809 RepID=A0AB33A4V5_9MYCO|nr:SDR family NAD(P)-dependent oxidoreductase [Mycobacteroides abscessus]AGM26744.1 putative oxidoreductase EphD [Mycobacteroides abscessus subsp. bolletii 50594]AMU63985.1 oxidoreductase [Mycobacteroides abscessus]AMU73354.1 oxidoreductase [Mycobacteroides abscessus]ANO12566.1 oxidoreductase [Mycobacteroides abscessus]ANO22296.1 oxidoreductase [Mycobacteroides abscessus]